MLSQMLLIRRFEEKAAQQYQRGDRIGGFCHLYIGQEAVIVGSVAATRPDDYLITAYRDHGHALARGTSADSCMAELFGKATGCSKAWAGPCTISTRNAACTAGTPSSASIYRSRRVSRSPASTGANEDRVTLCYMGDGAINIGAFHEALNMAGLYKLPVIFICENNYLFDGHARPPVQSAQGDRQPRQGLRHAQRGHRRHGCAFAVRDGLKRGSWKPSATTPQPYWVEIRTYRYRGHSMSDPWSLPDQGGTRQSTRTSTPSPSWPSNSPTRAR